MVRDTSMEENSQDRIDLIKEISFVLWFTLALNIVATLCKLVVGFITGSLSLIADGFDSLFDSASNIVGLIGIRFARKPPDDQHPYGHRKFETISALIISMFLFVTAWEILTNSLNRILNPGLINIEVNIWSFLALAISIIIHTYVVWYEKRAGRRLKSDFLIADANHTRADILLSVSVAGGLIGVILGYPIIDPILAIIIAFFIANIGIVIIKESVPTLVDRIILIPADIESLVLTIPGVISVDHIRSRGHESSIYIDLRLKVREDLHTEKAHEISNQVERKLKESYINIYDVIIHIEPAT